MPFQSTLAQLIEITHATGYHLQDLAQVAQGITTDSRAIQPGQLFLALRGERFDGHQFVEAAIAQGAVAAIVDRQYPVADSALPLVQVDDTLKAYQAIGRWWRQQFNIPVIGITGSVGKTTMKELVAALLSHSGKVLKSQANFNNEIGVPLTLLQLDADHDFAVIEMGMRGRGQIAELAQIAEPTIGLITTVGTAHIELLGSREAIAKAKCELFAELAPDKLAIFNADNALLAQTAAKVWQGKTLSYGFTQGDLQGQLPDGDTIEIAGVRYPLPLPGEHNAINYLGALAVLKALHLSWQPFESGLTVDLPGGRAKCYELPNDIALLDETYNAGLESMLASLKLLAQTPGSRHIAVLGTMRELGEFSVPFHRQVGEQVQELQIDRLLILADPAEAEALAQGAASVPTETFDSHEAVVERLIHLMQPGDRILFKASRAVGLDRVVNALRSANSPA
ncbi:UDP-N-acetylmuramoyl-tripeptide--D-alanyl-D-alanine ligase [Alkalinema sp. FACHB-956]|uniref:UDP-N-acetylmuramoyl-tripeptide--D-alanyl-D- alanine ligase n=1 Tax=Alkalinema sp. FACHB-956 TaxID=2692768 RepID=UPI001685FE13|nr:UDP-N-acetylmuramoyl-tripeptide--D-alanyl-D-alanine ligase [Alkalinema sp. FACHB-956]MBD2325432.1 UDP-N-acetylmuramoyl-tripeptide--D-alanyl-D-alanine ligase [Alkalinema sp. FACHB-956]